MHGIIIGIAAVLGLKWVAGRRCRRHGYHGHHGYHRFRRGRGRFGRSVMWHVFERLDTTPGQEKAIRSELEGLWERAHAVKGAFRQTGDDLGQAMRGGEFDRAAADAGLGAQEQALRELREAFLSALGRIHEVLDPRQREILADLLESGPRMRGGPYRGWV